MLESTLTQNIKQALRRRFPGIWVKKTHGGPYQDAGIPDLLICWEGVFIGMEVKVPGGKATPLQSSELRRIIEAKGRAGVVRSIDEAIELVERAGEEK